MGKGQPRRGRRRGSGPTVSDVARAAGVSQMTVSRVINREANVREETRAKVEEAIAALGYVPDPAARSLAGGGQCRIALLYSNPSAAYLSEFLAGSIAGAAASGAQLGIEHWDGAEGVEALARRLAAHRTDAVLLPPPLCESAALLDALTGTDMPVAQVATGEPSPVAHAVSIDDRAAAEAMTAHLIVLGHRRIGFIAGEPNLTASGLRRAGYEQALASAGITAAPALIRGGNFTYRSGLAAGEALLSLSSPPTAIFASNDDMAAAVVSVAHRRHLEVPGDLSVCGFDDTAMAITVWPELTTIRQPVAEMASAATELLVKAVRARRAGEELAPQHLQLPFAVISRDSVAPPRRSD
ncbi:MAG: LacI family DNA-binding transcriptional regulator [Novosphingobium sp.]|nr:LacI family DNA-binding transcriptional regulator [Novosphingobium sp.]